jgi:hypothetical protein
MTRVEEDIVESCYQATTGEDIEDCMSATVQQFVECVDPWYC